MWLEALARSLHQSIYRYPHALAYLRSRRVTEEEVKKYGVGFNKVVSVNGDGPDWERFIKECDRGRKFENKIVFPIRDIMGQVVGLSGRSIDTKEFKVFVTDVAKAMGFMFGLPEALPHIILENRVFVVEGYFDFLALAKVLPNTVAALTSKLNDQQYDLLTLYCDNIVVVFDSDKAGYHGREKAGEREGVWTVDLGSGEKTSGESFKDPAKCLETLDSMDKYRKHVMNKIKSIPLSGGI